MNPPDISNDANYLDQLEKISNETLVKIVPQNIERKSKVNKIFENLDNNPFGYKLDLSQFETNDLPLVGEKLKEFYHKHISSQSLDTHILIHYKVNGLEKSQPIDNASFKERFENLLNGNYVYKLEELPANASDDGTEIYLEFFDEIYFTRHEKISKPANMKNMNESNFWPYRLSEK